MPSLRADNSHVVRTLSHGLRAPAWLLMIGAALGACRGANEPPPCSAVASNFILLAEQNLAKVGELDATTRRNVHDQLPAMRDSLDRACRESSWSGAVRTCLATATDHVAFQACETQLTDEQRQRLANPPSD